MTHPYKKLPDHCFWTKSMSDPGSWQIDPVTVSRTIGKDEKVSTLGSCFAQHIARHIASIGLNYFVAEKPLSVMEPEEAKRRNYGVFSARYGNIYTVRQLLQLFKRAFGEFAPVEPAWLNGQRYVDPFRPQIEPDGFDLEDEVKEATVEHLSAVRSVFQDSDWIVFTLGLTEAWRSKNDGAIFPMAPGVAGGHFDENNYEFVNFTSEEVRSDLFEFIERVVGINPRVKFLLTVSPVPLMATYEDRHVLVSTCYSKAALRVACDEAQRRFDNVLYFPSYEIITSPAAGNRYFHNDLRQVTEEGVSHVMRVFSEHFIDTLISQSKISLAPSHSLNLKDGVVCDEEILDRI